MPILVLNNEFDFLHDRDFEELVDRVIMTILEANSSLSRTESFSTKNGLSSTGGSIMYLIIGGFCSFIVMHIVKFYEEANGFFYRIPQEEVDGIQYRFFVTEITFCEDSVTFIRYIGLAIRRTQTVHYFRGRHGLSHGLGFGFTWPVNFSTALFTYLNICFLFLLEFLPQQRYLSCSMMHLMRWTRSEVYVMVSFRFMTFSAMIKNNQKGIGVVTASEVG